MLLLGMLVGMVMMLRLMSRAGWWLRLRLWLWLAMRVLVALVILGGRGGMMRSGRPRLSAIPRVRRDRWLLTLRLLLVRAALLLGIGCGRSLLRMVIRVEWLLIGIGSLRLPGALLLVMVNHGDWRMARAALGINRLG